jgi:magnesium-transporting ATPase (P-type)
MITGDKMGTAKSIGYSCKMFTKENMEVVQIDEEYLNIITPDSLPAAANKEESKKTDNAGKEVKKEEPKKIESQRLLNEKKVVALLDEKLKKDDPYKKIGLLITGELVDKLVVSLEASEKFIRFAKSCNAVVCCRTSASQKAAVVKAMRRASPDEITLSIGDGGNDVPMIKEANIGVGIYGKEGMQAAQAADFAIGEFQCLWNLLMIHGRLAYLRISELILYFFYKNAVFTLPQFFYAFWCVYSGETIYDSYYITLYNVIFTCFPLGLKGLFEQDVMHLTDTKLNLNKIYPHLYYTGQGNMLFNIKLIGVWLLYGLFHAAIVFFLPYAFLLNSIVTQQGENPDMWFLSVTSFTSIIIMVNLKLFTTERNFNYLNVISFVILSIGFYIGIEWASDVMTSFNTDYTITILYRSPVYYLTILLCCCLEFTIDHFVQVYRFYISESPNDFCRLWAQLSTLGQAEDDIMNFRHLIEIDKQQRAQKA